MALAGIAVLALAAAGIYLSTPTSPGVAKRELFSEPATPKPVPDIRLQDEAGRQLTLADFRGRTILLNVWATWCTPCREEMPALDRLQAKLGSPKFEVVALSIDREGAAVVRKFFTELGVRQLKLYVDPSGEAAGRLATVGIPTTLLIDRDGREIGRRVGPAKWDGSAEVEAIRRRIQ